MKSNVCKIEKGTRDLAAILKESERVAEYNGLTHKQSLHLRLLCEELGGMLPNIIDDFEGSFWIEYLDCECKINVSIVIPELNANEKKELIGIANDKIADQFQKNCNQKEYFCFCFFHCSCTSLTWIRTHG